MKTMYIDTDGLPRGTSIALLIASYTLNRISNILLEIDFDFINVFAWILKSFSMASVSVVLFINIPKLPDAYKQWIIMIKKLLKIK